MDYTIIKCPHCEVDVGEPCVYSSSMGRFANPDTINPTIRMKMDREGLPLPHGRVHDGRKYWVERMHAQRRVTTVEELREALADLPAKAQVWVQTSKTGYAGMGQRDPLVYVESWGSDEVLISGDREGLVER